MRWQELFADLEAHVVSMERADDAGEIAERTRGEVAQVLLLNRLRANVACRLTVWVEGAGELTGQLQRVGADWFLLASTDEVIVSVAALLGVVNLPAAAVSSGGVDVVGSRIRLTSVLRAVAKDRSAVRIVLRQGTAVAGTVERVGADFVDVAVHDLDQAPRADQVRSRVTISLASVACVRRQPSGWE
jgi:hypothetical protein